MEWGNYSRNSEQINQKIKLPSGYSEVYGGAYGTAAIFKELLIILVVSSY
jgi:Cu/Ag efflux pump CusA